MKNSDYYSKKNRKIRMDEKKDKVRKTQTMVLFVFFEVLMLMCVTGALFFMDIKAYAGEGAGQQFALSIAGQCLC